MANEARPSAQQETNLRSNSIAVAEVSGVGNQYDAEF